MPDRFSWFAVRVVLAACFIAAPVSHARAQGSAVRSIHGTVRDSATGRAIEGAIVSLTQPARLVSTNADGHYDMTDLPALPVVLTVRQVGYSPAVRRVDLGAASVTLDVTLAPHVAVLQELTAIADSGDALLRQPTSTTTLNAQDIAELRGQTLGETIKELPGVAAITFGPAVAKPVIRGLSSQRIIVMNSGMRLEDQQWGSDHSPEIDTFEADAISVIRGTGAVLYGPDALGGVVRVERPPVPGTGGFSGSIGVNLFTNNLQGAISGMVQGANLTLPGLGRTGYRLRLTARRAGDAKTPSYYIPNTGFSELDGSGAIGVHRTWGSSEILFSIFTQDIGVYSGSHVGNVDDLERAIANPRTTQDFSYEIKRPNQRVQYYMGIWRTAVKLPKDAALNINANVQYSWRREYDNNGPLRFRDIPAFDLRLTTTSLDLRYQHQPFGKVVGTWGATGLYQWNFSVGKAFLIPEYNLGSLGLFAQEDLALSRWTLSAGMRYDQTWQHTLPYADAGIISPDEQKTWNGLSGSIGASYLIGNDWSIAARGAVGWRPPSVNERFALGVHHGTATYEIGDTSLVPERKFGPEVSLRHQGRNVQVDLTAYWNRVNNFIYLQPIPPVQTIRGAFPAYLYTQTNATLRGLEAQLGWFAKPWLSFQATGSLVRGWNRRDNKPLFDMPADRLNLSARYIGSSTALHEWHVQLGTLLVRKQDQVPPGTVYSLPTAGYVLVNAEAGISALPVFGSGWDIVLAVENVFDVAYRDYLSRYRIFVNDPGRNVALRVSIPIGL